MSMLNEFKEFAVKGNAVDMAVGIIIGAAFGKIVSSIVGDVLMPPIGALLGGVDFTALAFTVSPATATTPAVVIGYGKFIQALVDFVIVAFAMFLLVKGINSLKLNVAPTAKQSAEAALLTEIRDLMKARD